MRRRTRRPRTRPAPRSRPGRGCGRSACRQPGGSRSGRSSVIGRPARQPARPSRRRAPAASPPGCRRPAGRGHRRPCGSLPEEVRRNLQLPEERQGRDRKGNLRRRNHGGRNSPRGTVAARGLEIAFGYGTMLNSRGRKARRHDLFSYPLDAAPRPRHTPRGRRCLYIASAADRREGCSRRSHSTKSRLPRLQVSHHECRRA